MKNKLMLEVLEVQKEQGRKSILAFAQHFLPHHLKYSTSIAHREIYEILSSMSRERGKRFAVAAPRRFGKSTLITFIYVLYSICYGLEEFIVIISNTTLDAIPILDNIKKEFKENEKLMLAFPEVCKSKVSSRLLQCWQKDRIITANKVQVRVFSIGQNIRGIKFGATRPSLIIADDLENAKNTFSPDSRAKTKDFFENAVLLIGSEESNFIFIGNLFHPHCLLSDYVCNDQNNPWINRRYAAVERLPDRRDLWDQWGSIYNFKEDFEGGTGQKAALAFYEKNKADMDKGAVLLWPERYALYDLMILRNENEISFMSEMQNEPMDPKRVVFHTDEFHYWDENFKTLDEFLRSLDLEFFAGCDPALGKNMEKGDYSAIVVLARDKKPPYTLYIVTADIRRRSVEELEDDILSYCKRYKFVKFGIESNQFQVLITRSLRKKADSLGIRVPFIEINSKGDKIARLQLLNLLVKTGALQFSRRHKELLEECRYFPKGKFDDGLDALEMAVQLAEGRNTVDPKENKKMLEDCKMKIHAPRPGKRADEYFIVNGKMVKNVFNLLKVNQLRPPIEDNGKKS